MKFIKKRSALQGTIQIPGNKSASARAIVLDGLAGGVSRVSNPLPGVDRFSIVDMMQALGAKNGTSKPPGVGLRRRGQPALCARLRAGRWQLWHGLLPLNHYCFLHRRLLGHFGRLSNLPALLAMAYVLSPILESSFRQPLSLLGGSFGVFFSRPISRGCKGSVNALLILQIASSNISRRRMKIARGTGEV